MQIKSTDKYSITYKSSGTSYGGVDKCYKLVSASFIDRLGHSEQNKLLNLEPKLTFSSLERYAKHDIHIRFHVSADRLHESLNHSQIRSKTLKPRVVTVLWFCLDSERFSSVEQKLTNWKY